MILVVIDGQGGRMGSLFIEKWKKQCPDKGEIIAVGTNSIATAAMLRAGADHAATGENPVLVNVKKADYIIGPIGILAADALYGEITDRMAIAIARSRAKKLLIPVNTCGVFIPGQKELTITGLVDELIQKLQDEQL